MLRRWFVRALVVVVVMSRFQVAQFSEELDESQSPHAGRK